jgi:predicted DCC family thiol-disulfide oxidoreductase YuxK
MTTEIEPCRKILAYDGDCPMCTAMIARLIRAGWVAPEQARSNRDLSPADLSAVEAAGIRNQMVVLDAQTRETRAGARALLWIVAENLGSPWWVRLVSLPGARHLLAAGYQTISYNRRVISPPAHRVRCDCEPEVTLGRRLSLIVPLVVLSVLVTGLFGAAVSAGSALVDPIVGALVSEVAGIGWLALVVASIVALRGQQRADYLAHLAVTAFAGAVVLLPCGILAWWLPRDAKLAFAGMSILASFALMFRMQRRRVALGCCRL